MRSSPVWWKPFPLTRDAAKPAGRVLRTLPTMCWAARRIDPSRNGVYAAKQFGLLVAGAVLSVALFVSGAVVAVTSLVLRLC